MSDKTLRIDLTVSDRDAIDAIEQAAEALDKVTRSYGGVTQAIDRTKTRHINAQRQLNQANRGGGSGGGGGGGAGPSGTHASQRRGPKGPNNPWADLGAAQAMYAAAVASGDPNQINPALLQMAKAQRRVTQAKNIINSQYGPPTQKPQKTAGQLWMDALMTSRVGNNVSPLVGRMVPALSATTGMGAPQLMIAAAAITAFTMALVKGHDRVIEFSKMLFGGGGTITQTGAAYPLMVALGGRGSTAEIQGFGNLLHGGGLAAGAAASLGINPVGGPFGDFNYTNKYLQALRKLSDPGMNQSDAKRISMMLGIEEQVGQLRMMSPGLRKRLLSENLGHTETTMRQHIDTQAILGLEMDRFMKAMGDLGTIILPLVNAGLEMLVSLFRGITGILGYDDKKYWADTEKASRDRNTRAIDELTAIIGDTARWYGDRGQGPGVLPPGYTRFLNLSKVMNGYAKGLGAVSI